MSVSKVSVNYQLPEICCAKCVQSYLNSYGDCQCRKVEPTTTINAGAHCELFILDPVANVQIIDRTVKPEPWETSGYETGTCADCSYSFDAGAGPTCALTGKSIRTDGRCKKYERTTETEQASIEDAELVETPVQEDVETEPEAPVKPGNIGACWDCSFSEYKDDKAYCSIHKQNIENDDWCYEWREAP